jgi:hypothetical protein
VGEKAPPLIGGSRLLQHRGDPLRPEVATQAIRHDEDIASGLGAAGPQDLVRGQQDGLRHDREFGRAFEIFGETVALRRAGDLSL